MCGIKAWFDYVQHGCRLLAKQYSLASMPGENNSIPGLLVSLVIFSKAFPPKSESFDLLYEED
jgi:hypothetical protein